MTTPRTSYDYANRDGVDRVSWERFHALTRFMSEQLANRNGNE